MSNGNLVILKLTLFNFLISCAYYTGIQLLTHSSNLYGCNRANPVRCFIKTHLNCLISFDITIPLHVPVMKYIIIPLT